MMEAIAMQYGTAKDFTNRSWSISQASAKSIAKALQEAGFRMAADEVDTKQNQLLEELRERVSRLEGYTGLPTWQDPPSPLRAM